MTTGVGAMRVVLPKDASSKDAGSAADDSSKDVASEVRESIHQQQEMERESWYKNESTNESKGASKEAESTSASKEAESQSKESDASPFFDENAFKDFFPFGKKGMESKSGSAEKTVKSFEEGGQASKEEINEFIKEEKTLISQCDSALNQLTTGLKDGSLPFFVRPVARMLIENLKRIKGKAQGRLTELDQSLKEAGEGVKPEVKPAEGAKSAEGVKSAEGAEPAEGVKEEVKEAQAGVKPEAKLEGVKEEAKKTEGAKAGVASEAAKKAGEEAKDLKEWFKTTFNGDNPKNIVSALLWLGATAGMFAVLMRGRKTDNAITYDEFVKEFLLKGRVKEITMTEKGRIYVEILNDFESKEGRKFVATAENQPILYHFDVPDTTEFMKAVEDMEFELGLQREDFVPMSYRVSSVGNDTVSMVTSILMLVIFASLLIPSRKGGMNSFMNKAMGMGDKPIEIVKNTGVTFKDVAGIDEAKTEIMEFIDFLKNSEKYAKLGAKLPKGAILTGPPGTGKTLLVKAAAGEANVPFISMSGSDFVELFVGMGAKRVRELFAEARKNAPCIVFIDEIDAIGKKRNEGKFTGANDEREQTLNQILIEMDGFKPRDGITVFAGTNRVDVLDPALLRAGRFDRHIAVDKPDLRGRVAIAKIYLSKVVVDGDVDAMAQKLAEMTPGYTGADICNIVNEAAIIAIRRKHEKVELLDIIAAVDRVLCGMEKKNDLMTHEEKRRIAYHEAGHAIIGWLSEHVDPMLKVTIVPRSNGALGFTQNLPKEIPLYSQEEMREMLVQLMGGRAAEKLFCGNMTTGASDDLSKATKLAYGMVAGYGFDEEVGPVNYQQEEEGFQKPYSEATGKAIDDQARRILKESMANAVKMLEANREKMVRIAELLLERETITSVDMEAICGKRKGRSPTNYSNIIRDMEKKEKEKEKEEKKEEVKEVKEEKKETTNTDTTGTTSAYSV
ncbi:hypothetical protein WA556_005668 [Blastocystis sp. ATCC 50177/Nand II]